METILNTHIMSIFVKPNNELLKNRIFILTIHQATTSHIGLIDSAKYLELTIWL